MRIDHREPISALLNEVAYLGRFAFVSLKETLGLPRSGDRTFYIDRFARALRSGALGRDYKIMATGKDDGAGSQAQAAMSAICFAKAFGLEYVHRPFTSMQYEAHAPSPGGAGATLVVNVAAEGLEQWEEHFNLGHGVRRLAQCASPVVPLDELLMAPDKWPKDVVVAAPHYLYYCNLDPEAWERALPTLRANYRRNKPPRKTGGFTIALHLRRGTVRPDNKKVARNFTPDATFLAALRQVLDVVSARVTKPAIKLFSQGDARQFTDFERLGCELHLDEPAIDSHAQLVDADVFIMSKGAFSYTAGVLNEGITLYDPQKYRALAHWIERTPDGQFDAAAFASRLDALLAEKGL